MSKYNVLIVPANKGTMMSQVCPVTNVAFVMHLEEDTTYLDDRFSPPRPEVFKAGWYYDMGEFFGGPFVSEELARSQAIETMGSWAQHCDNAMTEYTQEDAFWDWCDGR